MAQRGRKPQKNKITTPSILHCGNCNKDKKASEFYVSSSVYHVNTSRVQFCKICCISMSCESDGSINIDKFKNILKQIDKPFIYDVLQSAYDESKNVPNDTEKETHPLRKYFKNINSLPQYKGLTWKDSLFESQSNKEIINNNTYNSISKFEEFVPTDVIYEKWGYGYSNEEYYYFEKKWNKLIDNYGEKTAFHTEGLITYIRFRVKEELATARGDVKEAKEWAIMAKDAGTAAKINVSQLSKSDISGGVDLVPQIYEAVESKVGVIKILPHLKEQPYDDADMIIWCIVNYLRRLEDKSRISYRDIWNFYDEMVSDYYKSQGKSEKEIQEERKKRNSENFKDLGEVYKEPLYEEGADNG